MSNAILNPMAIRTLLRKAGYHLPTRTFTTMSAPSMPHLSAPLKIGDLTMRNRNVMASLTRNRSVPDTVPNEYNLEYYAQRAKGGVGLLMSEGTLVSRQGTEWPVAPGIWSEDHVAGWRKVTNSVHQAGALIFCQV